MDRKRNNQEQKQPNNQSASSEKSFPWVPVMAAFIAATGYVVVALINRSTAIETTLKPIQYTQTAEALHTAIAATTQAYLPLVTNTSTPTQTLSNTPTESMTLTPSATPTPKYSDAIIVMNNFYSWINNAGNKDDLRKSWELETSGVNGLQCSESAGCDFIKFRDWWWDWKVQYKLYDCGSNIVDTEQRYYRRDPKLATTPTAPIYIRYQLVVDSGELKINSGHGVEGPGSDCQLKVQGP